MEIQGVQQLDPQEAQARLAAGAVLLDVREEDEWRQARVPGSILLPMSQIVERIDEVPKAPLVILCRSGNRSQQVAAWLRPQGFEAANLMHGIMGWARMGLPIETGPEDS